MVQNKGAKEIAKELLQYIKPVADITNTRPYDEYRKRFGKPKSYKVNNRPAGSVQFNAIRIARTETSHVYRQATLDFYEDKPYIKGYSWNLSNRHPVKDECDLYASRTYATRNSIPRQHPNCLCSIQAIPMTAAELRAYQSKTYKGPIKYRQSIINTSGSPA